MILIFKILVGKFAQVFEEPYSTVDSIFPLLNFSLCNCNYLYAPHLQFYFFFFLLGVYQFNFNVFRSDFLLYYAWNLWSFLNLVIYAIFLLPLKYFYPPHPPCFCFVLLVFLLIFFHFFHFITFKFLYFSYSYLSAIYCEEMYRSISSCITTSVVSKQMLNPFYFFNLIIACFIPGNYISL